MKFVVVDIELKIPILWYKNENTQNLYKKAQNLYILFQNYILLKKFKLTFISKPKHISELFILFHFKTKELS
jgi:hypothetical protein